MAGRRFTVSGQGYSTEGRIRTTDGSPLPGTVEDTLLAMALCTDSELRDGEVDRRPHRGRPAGARREGRHRHRRAAPGQARGWRRCRSTPTTSSWPPSTAGPTAPAGTWCAASSRAPRTCWSAAPTATSAAPRSWPSTTPPGSATPAPTPSWPARACGCSPSGRRTSPPDGRRGRRPTRRTCSTGSSWSRWSASSTRPGPRPATPSPQCRDAGIRVRMITGDHAVTAGAIAADLGIPGQAVTGADLDRIADDAELARRLDDDRRGRPGLPRAQDPHRARAAGPRRRRRDDRRRGQRRPRPAQGRHRRRDGRHRHRGHQGSRDDDPHRRQLRHHRRRGPRGPRDLRQHRQVRAVPAVHRAGLRASPSWSPRSPASPAGHRSPRCRSCSSTSSWTARRRCRWASTRSARTPCAAARDRPANAS